MTVEISESEIASYDFRKVGQVGAIPAEGGYETCRLVWEDTTHMAAIESALMPAKDIARFQVLVRVKDPDDDATLARLKMAVRARLQEQKLA